MNLVCMTQYLPQYASFKAKAWSVANKNNFPVNLLTAFA